MEAGATDSAPPAEAGAPDPGTGETYMATALSRGTGQRTDRRPMPVGFYDASVNKTFVSWMGPGSDALVKEYDHATGMWSADKIAGNSPFSDSHNYPSMIKGRDNRLYIFYGCHNSPLRMAVSPNPLSTAGTWRDVNIGAAPDASYPAPVVTSDGDHLCVHPADPGIATATATIGRWPTSSRRTTARPGPGRRCWIRTRARTT